MMNRIKGFIARLLHRFLARFINLLLKPIAWSIASFVDPNKAFDTFFKYNMYLLHKRYYLPIPDEVDMAYAQRETDLIGVDMNVDAAFEFLEEVVQPYKAEFNAFPLHAADKLGGFYLVNGTYMAIDGNVYYGLIRHNTPQKVIEIGSGNSTLLAAAAIRKNKEEGVGTTQLISIEPYPREMLRQEIPEITDLIEKRVQDVDMSVFESLVAGDLLFIDSTHVLRPGGDVWWEYCEILPRLQSGVLVHIHDVSLPKPYPLVYADYHWYWNEQYALQMLLSYSNRFEVVWPGNYLLVNYPEKMKAAFNPEFQQMRDKFPYSEAAAFWMRVR